MNDIFDEVFNFMDKEVFRKEAFKQKKGFWKPETFF